MFVTILVIATFFHIQEAFTSFREVLVFIPSAMVLFKKEWGPKTGTTGKEHRFPFKKAHRSL